MLFDVVSLIGLDIFYFFLIFVEYFVLRVHSKVDLEILFYSIVINITTTTTYLEVLLLLLVINNSYVYSS